MPDLHYLFNSINGGEMSPQMDLRVDNPAYNSGARVLENFIVKPYGGIYKRPGTEFLMRTYNNAVARIEPFNRNQDVNYILEFTPGYLRIIVANDSTNAELDTWTPYNADGTTDYEQDYMNKWTLNGSVSTGWVPGLNITNPTSNYNGLYYKNKLYTCNATITATSTTDQPLSGANWTNYWTEFSYQVNDRVYVTDNTGYTFLYKCIQSNSIALTGLLYNWPTPTFNQIESTFLAASAYWERLPSYPAIVFKTPYDTEEKIFNLQIEAVNDTVFIVEKSSRPRKLTRNYNGSWSFEDVVFDFAPALDVDVTPATLQIQYNQNEWAPNVNYLIGDRVVVTTADYSDINTISASGLFTCNTAHTSTSGISTNTGKPGSTSGTWTSYWNRGTNNSKFNKWAPSTSYKNGDTVWYGKSLYRCLIAHTSDGINIGRSTKIAMKTYGKTEPTAGKIWTIYWMRVGAGTDLSDLRYKLVSDTELFTSNSVGETWQIRVPVNNYYRKLSLDGTAEYAQMDPTDEIFLQGQLLVSSRWDLGYAPPGTYTLEESTDGVTWNAIQLFVVESVKDNNISFTYQAPTKGAWYRLNGIRAAGVGSTLARSIIIEPANSIITVPFIISEYVSKTQVKGYPTFNSNQIMPDEAVGVSTSYFKKPAFSSATGYPASVALHESRLWFGGVETHPTRVWGSQKDDFYNFLLGTLDTDALDLTLASKHSNRIRWIKSFNKQLIVATDGEVYSVDAGESDASINPTTIRGRIRLYNGGCNIPGIVTTDALLYFQNGNRRLREFAYNFQTDAYVAPDMTVFADHLNATPFVQASMMKHPDTVLWCVNNGQIYGFSYDRAQNITAWHRHTTASPRMSAYANSNTLDPDRFVSVACINGLTNSSIKCPDEVWFVVYRNGYYNLERFDKNIMNYVYGGALDAGDTNLSSTSREGSIHYGYLDSYTSSSQRFDTTFVSGVSAGKPATVYIWTDATGSTLDPDRANYALYNRKLYAIYDDAKVLSLSATFPDSTNNVAYTDNKTTRIVLSANDGYGTGSSTPYGDAALTIGIPVYSLYIPTRFDIKLDNGTSLGRKIRINRVQFKPWRSQGGKYVSLDSFRSTLSGGVKMEDLPTYDTPTNSINYDAFNFNITPDKQSSYVLNYPQYQVYSGSTTDTAINGNWTENPLFAVVHYDAAPFNLMGMVWKMEVQGN